MYTLSYFPVSESKVVLTSNRDEEISRDTTPFNYPKSGYNIVYPKDILAGETCIASADNGRIVCLLKSAFEKHIRKINYAKVERKLF